MVSAPKMGGIILEFYILFGKSACEPHTSGRLEITLKNMN